MKIVLTGAAGYLGSYLCNFLPLDWNITAIDDLMYNQGALIYHIMQKNNIEFYLDDVVVSNEFSMYEDADVIIPLAAIVGAPACDQWPVCAKNTNLDYICDLVKVLKPHQKLIYFCTNSGYGNSPDEICTEESPFQSLSHYARLKEAAEQIVMQRANSISLRLATVFGVSCRHRLDLLVNDLVYKACKRNKLKIYQGNFKRNFVHILDVCAAVKFCINNFDSLKGEVYNLGHDESNMTKLELVDIIRKNLDGNLTVQTIEEEDPDKRNYFVSSAKLANKGFKANIGLDEGVKELIDYYTLVAHLPKKLRRMMQNKW